MIGEGEGGRRKEEIKKEFIGRKKVDKCRKEKERNVPISPVCYEEATATW